MFPLIFSLIVLSFKNQNSFKNQFSKTYLHSNTKSLFLCGFDIRSLNTLLLQQSFAFAREKLISKIIDQVFGAVVEELFVLLLA